MSMARGMVTDTHKAHSDDVLYTLRADNNMVVDNDVRQDDGLIYSMQERQAFIWFPSIPLMRWSDPNQPPYLSQQVFFVAHEMDDPARISRAVNGVMEACINKAAAGEDHVGNPEVDTLGKTAIIAIIVAGLIFLVALLLAYSNSDRSGEAAGEGAGRPAVESAAPAVESAVPAAGESQDAAAEPAPAEAAPVDPEAPAIISPPLPGSDAEIQQKRQEILDKLLEERNEAEAEDAPAAP